MHGKSETLRKDQTNLKILGTVEGDKFQLKVTENNFNKIM